MTCPESEEEFLEHNHYYAVYSSFTTVCEVYRMLRALLEGCHLGIYSYIKPGGVHRLRLSEAPFNMMSSCIGAIEFIEKALSYGELVRKGSLAAGGIELGKLLSKALRESYIWTNYKVYPDIVIPTVVNALILSHTEPESILRNMSNLRKSLAAFVGGSRWRDVREVINALRAVGREDVVDHASSYGISPAKGFIEEVSLEEFFKVLGSKWPGFLAICSKEDVLYNGVKAALEYYEKYRDANSAAIATYIELVNPRLPEWAKQEAAEALRKGLMTTREGASVLFRLDQRLVKEGFSFDEYVPLLASVMQLAIYEGMRI